MSRSANYFCLGVWRVGGVVVILHAVLVLIVCFDVVYVYILLNIRLVSIVSRSVQYSQL